MNPATYALCEAVFDLAYCWTNTGVYNPADSRETVRLTIEWAEEFERVNHGAKWGETDTHPDYYEAIDAFHIRKHGEWLATNPDTTPKRMLFAVETRTAGEWEDCWTENDAPARFTNRERAEEAITEHIEDATDAVKLGHLTDAPTRADFRIVEVAS